MRNFVKILTATFALIAFEMNAQQVVVKKDTINETEVTLSMDKRIDGAIEDMENACAKKNTDAGPTNTTTTPRISVPNKPLSTAEICRQNPKVLGYKIQLVVVKSNDEANQVKAFFRNRFPTIKAETDASLRPNYKVLAGSYFTKESAASDLKKIRQYFKSAIPVQYRVFCAESK